MGLDCYKWYQSQTLSNVPARRLNLEGGWTRAGVPARMLKLEGMDWGIPHRLEKGASVSEDTGPKGMDWGGPTLIGEWNECHRGRWPQRARLGGPTSIGKGNECQRGRWVPKVWIGGSHIDRRRERVPARTLSLEGMD